MSVILYSKDELLGAFAACWDRGSIGSLDAKRRFVYLAEAANRITEANRQAYNATYSDTAGAGGPHSARSHTARPSGLYDGP